MTLFPQRLAASQQDGFVSDLFGQLAQAGTIELGMGCIEHIEESATQPGQLWRICRELLGATVLFQCFIDVLFGVKVTQKVYGSRQFLAHRTQDSRPTVSGDGPQVDVDLLELLYCLLKSLRVVAVSSYNVPDRGGFWVLHGDGKDAVLVSAIVLFHKVLIQQSVPGQLETEPNQELWQMDG